jgi:F-type H+-transporting ATPase subunit c
MTTKRKELFVMFYRNALLVVVSMMFSGVAFAAEGAAAGVANPYAGLAAAFAIGVAALGGALGQGRAVTAALEGIARNPAAQGKIFIPMILGLALIESLVIYALVIAFKLSG